MSTTYSGDVQEFCTHPTTKLLNQAMLIDRVAILALIGYEHTASEELVKEVLKLNPQQHNFRAQLKPKWLSVYDLVEICLLSVGILPPSIRTEKHPQPDGLGWLSHQYVVGFFDNFNCAVRDEFNAPPPLSDDASQVIKHLREIDAATINALMTWRVPCSQRLADASSIVVREEQEGDSLGFFGLLNGLLGVNEKPVIRQVLDVDSLEILDVYVDEPERTTEPTVFRQD